MQRHDDDSLDDLRISLAIHDALLITVARTLRSVPGMRALFEELVEEGSKLVRDRTMTDVKLILTRSRRSGMRRSMPFGEELCSDELRALAHLRRQAVPHEISTSSP